MKTMKRVSCLMSHGRGFSTCSGSTSSVGNRGLADVVEQVVGEDLNRSHRQERHEDARPQHAEHVAEVAAGPHADVLEDVGEDLASLDHALFQDQQGLFQQDHVRRLFGDVHGGIDADADVGGAQGRGVVDAVAHEADGVLAGLQGLDDALLVSGRDAGKQRGLARRVGKLIVGHLLDLAAEQHELGGQPDLLADLAGDQIVVAGDDLDRDAVALQGLDGRRGGLLGRIEEGDIAVQDQVALVGLGVGRGVARDDAARRDVLAGDGQHAEAVGARAARTPP